LFYHVGLFRFEMVVRRQTPKILCRDEKAAFTAYTIGYTTTRDIRKGAISAILISTPGPSKPLTLKKEAATLPFYCIGDAK